MIVGVVNQKGGVGKTTIATNLAACFAGEGVDTLLIDADTQGSSLEWKADRPESARRVQVIGLPVKNLHQEIGPLARKYEVVVIDGGGRVTATARAAVLVADFIIVPTLPSKPDILSTQDFFTTVIEEVTTMREVAGAILINQVQTGTTIGRKSQEYIAGLGYPVFKSVLHQYVAYREAIAAGLSAAEYEAGSKAAGEFAAFFQELQGVMG